MQLRVAAKSESFRRAGLAFGRTPRMLDIEPLSKEQLAALLAEPNLKVALLVTKDELHGHPVEALVKTLGLPASVQVEVVDAEPSGAEQTGHGKGNADTGKKNRTGK